MKLTKARNRLLHSDVGQIRSMQMSSNQLFVFVEGVECDPYFFGGICSHTLEHQVSYEIVPARQISSTGGKNALIEHFSFLRRRKALVSTLAGKTTVCIFFLDKDLDDIHHKRKRSAHAIYTEHYDVQNYVFEHGDLAKGAAAAASIDPRKLDDRLSDAALWCKQAAWRWREWIVLCLRSQQDGIPGEANYRVLSRIQCRHSGPIDRKAHDESIRRLASSAGVAVPEFRSRLTLTRERVLKYFSRGQHHRLFKGKWFAAILSDEIDCIMGGNPYNKTRLAGRLPSAIAATLDFSESWAEHFKRPLRAIVDLL